MKKQTISLDAAQMDNAVLKRLIEEIRSEKELGTDAYNRAHNRHNRTPSPRPIDPKPNA